MGTLGQDLSYSLRSLRKAPAFTVVAIVTLALGVGANSAIFTVVNAVLLRPLPFSNPGRVVNLAWDGSGYLQSLSATKFQYWHDHARSFEAMAMILLVGAGLLLGTLSRLTSFDRGFDVHDLVVARLTSAPARGASSQDLWEFERRVLQQVEGLPAIASIAAANSLPLERGVNTPMTIAGRPELTGTVEWRAVTPGYFDTLGIARSAGRLFASTDAAGAPAVAIVNDTFARRYFAGASPIGQRIDVGRFRGAAINPGLDGRHFEIVGVVQDVRDVSLRTESRRTIYVPQAQAPTRLSMLLRTMPVFMARPRSGGAPVERMLKEAIHGADPSLPPPQVFPMETVVAARRGWIR